MRPSIGTNGKGRRYIKSMVVNAGRVIEIDGGLKADGLE